VRKDEIKTQFGLVIRAWRSQRGISQEELAERAGLHRTYVSDVERGCRNVSLASIDRLAAALALPVWRLFNDMGNAAGGISDADGATPQRFGAILFVEDRVEDAELTMKALDRAKIVNKIHLVRDGEGALEFLFGDNGNGPRHVERPQLILLDLGLPKISGTEVLRRIKSDPRTRNIPVVILTASRRDRDFIASRQLGADAYIVKPVDFESLSVVTPQLRLFWALLGGDVEALRQGG
jgi:two-component system response regulator